MDAKNSIVNEVTIQEGRVAYLGKTDKKLNPCTKVIDVKGRTVIPGLIDGHNHFIPLALAPGHDVRLETAWTIPEAMARIKERTKTTPSGAFITSTAGWAVMQFTEKRMPTMAELDQAAPDNPVFIYPNGPGGAVVNSKAKAFFEEKGVQVNADGTINGTAGSQGFSGPFAAMRALQSFDELKERALDAENYAVSLGLTTNVDGGITYLRGTPDLQDATTSAAGMEVFNPWTAYDPILALNREGKLIGRIRAYWYGQDTRMDVPLLKQHLLNTFPYFGDDMFRQSGIGERPVSWTLPAGSPPRTAPPENFETALMLIAKYRWSFIHHAISAADSKMITETMERVNKTYPIADLRWSLLHTADISDDTLNRLKAMGAGVQPNGWPYIEAVPPNTTAAAGPPFRRILDNGVHVGGGSACVGVCGLDPWLMIYYMVTGKNAGGQMKNAGNQITRMEALRLYTAAPPWFFHEEDKLGSLETNKLGDMVVLSDDYTDPKKVSDDEIRNLKSVLTVVGGKVVYNNMH